MIQKYINIHIYTYTHTPFQIIFHYRLLQDIKYKSLWYTLNPCCSPVYRRRVYLLAPYSQLPCPLAGASQVAVAVKNLPTSTREVGSISGSGRSPEVGKGCPLQYSGWENSMDCILRGVEKSWTRLSDFHFTC